MKNTDGSEDAKRRAGEVAADEVMDGMVVGLGTGSTTAHAIRTLGDATKSGLNIKCVPTSFQSRQLAVDCGIALTSLEESTADIAIDGADQITNCDAGVALIKGGGGAHAREKVVDASATRFIVVADASKEVGELTHPVPVAVLPDAYPVVADRVRTLGGDPVLRAAEHKDGPVVTDNGNLVLDCDFGSISDPESLAVELSSLPGAVEHGLFVGVADAVYIGTENGVDVREF